MPVLSPQIHLCRYACLYTTLGMVSQSALSWLTIEAFFLCVDDGERQYFDTIITLILPSRVRLCYNRLITGEDKRYDTTQGERSSRAARDGDA